MFRPLNLVVFFLGLCHRTQGKDGPGCLSNPMADSASIDLAVHGYHLAKADPTKESGDAGITSGSIFQYKCDGGYWDFFTVIPDLNCDVSMKSTWLSSYEDYTKEREKETSSETNFDLEADVKFKGVKASASYGYSNKKSGIESDLYNAFKSNKSEVALSKAQCTTIDVALSPMSRPKFTGAFITGLQQLEVAAEAPEREKRLIYQKFIKAYGTHVFRSVQFGASLEVSTIYGDRSKTLLQQQERQSCSSTSHEACAGGGFEASKGGSAKLEACVNTSEEKCQSTMTKSDTGGNNNDITVRSFSRGSPPLDLSEWKSTAFDPVPILVKAAPLENILRQSYLEASDGYGIKQRIDATKVLAVLKEGMEKWYMCPTEDCPVQLTQAEIDKPTKGCGINDRCAKSFQDCVDDAKNENGYVCKNRVDPCESFALKMGNQYLQVINGKPGLGTTSNHDDWTIRKTGNDCDVELLQPGTENRLNCGGGKGHDCGMATTPSKTTAFILEGKIKPNAPIELRTWLGGHLWWSQRQTIISWFEEIGKSVWYVKCKHIP